MRKYFYFSAVVALCGCLCSCDFGGGSKYAEYYPVKLEKGDSWGMMTGSGKILFEDEFANEPTVVREGVFSVQEGEGYSLYTASEKPKLVPGCEGLYAVGYMNDGLVPIVRPDERISIVDKSGKTKFTLDPIKGEEITYSSDAFHDGLLRIQNQQSLYGFVDETGKAVVTPKYDYANDFNEGYAICRKDTPADTIISFKAESKKYVVINKKGEEVLSIKAGLKPRYYVQNGVIVVEDEENDRYGFLDLKGEFNKVPSKVKGIGLYNDDYYVFYNDESKYGLMSRKEHETLIRAKYDELVLTDDGKIIAVDGRGDDQRVYIINENDEKLVTIKDYNVDRLLYDGSKLVFAVKEGKTGTLLNEEGEPIDKKFEYYDLGSKSFLIYWGSLISSNYFDLNAMVARIDELVTSDGGAGYKVGDKATNYVSGGPRDYGYSYNLTPSLDDMSGYKYSLSAYAVTTRYIATSEWNRYSYTYDYSFDPYSTIEKVTIRVYSENKCWKKAKDELIKVFEDKGYKMVSEDSEKVQMKTYSCELTMEKDSDYRFYIYLRPCANEDYVVADSAPAY